MEVWKDVVGYEGLYQVSNKGRVKRLINFDSKLSYSKKELTERKEKILKEECSNGYLRVTLTKNKKYKHFKVHRLVAEAFIPNPNNLPQINHKDINRKNNNVSNLEWCTAKYNMNYGKKPKVVTKEKRMWEKLNEATSICFNLDKGLKDLLEECSRKTRQTKSRFIREALIKEIDRIKKEK